MDTDTFLNRMSEQMQDLMERARQNEIASAQMTRMLKQIRKIMGDNAPFDASFVLNLLNLTEMEGLAA